MKLVTTRKIEEKALKQIEVALDAEHWLDDYPFYTGLSIINPSPIWFRRTGLKTYRRRLYRHLKKRGLLGKTKWDT